MLSRLLRAAIVIVLGLALGAAVYLAFLVSGSPTPRQAQGWTLLATLPTARGETAAAVAGGRLYVMGGLTGLGLEATDEATAYDPSRDEWQAIASLPAARHHAAAAGLDGLVFVSGGGGAGGEPQAATLWSYDPAADAWTELAPMPESRFGHRMVTLDGMLYVVGGVGDTGRVLSYDVATDAWSTGAEMPAPRDHLAAVVADREIWAIGGRVSGQIQARVDIYDPATDQWRSGPPLPEATSGASEGVLGDVILLSGGEDPGQDGRVIDAHWQLDTSLGQAAAWQPLVPPPLAVHGAHGAVIDGRFVIAGGASRQGSLSRFSWSGLAQFYGPPE